MRDHTKIINPKLNSATDPGLRSAAPMLTQRQQHTCTRRAVLNFSIGGRETIRQYFIVRGGSSHQELGAARVVQLVAEDPDLAYKHVTLYIYIYIHTYTHTPDTYIIDHIICIYIYIYIYIHTYIHIHM